MEITILESNPDKGLLRKLTFCFSADQWQARANGGSGGGGFFLAGEDFGRMFNHSFPVCIFFFFFCKWKLPCTHRFPLAMPGSVYSGSVR